MSTPAVYQYSSILSIYSSQVVPTTSAVSAASQEGVRLRLLRMPLQLALNNNRSRERCTRCTLAPMQVCAVSLSWRVSSRVSFEVCSHRRAIYVSSNLVCVSGREMVGLPDQLNLLNCKRYQVQHVTCCYFTKQHFTCLCTRRSKGEARVNHYDFIWVICVVWPCCRVRHKQNAIFARLARRGQPLLCRLVRGSSGDPEQRATPRAAEALGGRR